MARSRRVTLMEREELSRMLAAGYRLRATGQALSRAPGTLSRERSRHHPSRALGSISSREKRSRRCRCCSTTGPGKSSTIP